MFDFLDKCTLLCGGPAASVPEEAEMSLKEHGIDDAADEEKLLDPVDSMDVKNYLVAHLSQPMGILFEENHADQYGGAFVAEINVGCSAAADGSICRGDQLVAIGEKRVSGMDFDEVMKLITGSVETKTKLSFFRGPAESLYGPCGASVEWLNEFVAERGEEAALVEDSESEASPDIEHVQAHHDVLDDVALAAAALNGDAVDETFFTACQTLLDAESHVEREDATAKAEESSVAVEDVVVAAEAVECKNVVDETFSTACQTLLEAESHVEKEDVAAKAEESSVAVDDDVVAAEVVECKDVDDETFSVDDDVVAAEVVECKDVDDETFSTGRQTLLDVESYVESKDVAAETEETLVAVEDGVVAADAVECDAEDTTENLVIDDEGDEDEEIERDFQVENEVDALATVEDNVDNEEDVECDTIPEAGTPMLNNAVNKASKDWLDKYLANPDNQTVSNCEVDAVDMVDEPTSDLEARCKKAVEVKEAALAANTINGTKGILKESRYSPKGVDEIKAFQSDLVSSEELNDDDSAVSSVWSEPDDYIGELEEVPMKRGSTLAALGAASTLTANMMLA